MGTEHPTGLSRPRLRNAAASLDACICSIVAPAGFGKSTLLRELLAIHTGPFANIAAGSHLAGGSLLVEVERSLARTFNPDAPDLPNLIVVDDAHLVEGSPAANDLQTIVERAGSDTRIVLAGRLAPPVDLHTIRLKNLLCEIDAEDLRFRSWEVEELFTTVYGVRLPPTELTVLAAATEGWAAGLQLYRHAIKRASPTARLHQLKLLSQSRLTTLRTYLAMNVLDDLEEPLRSFALKSSILGHMEPKACNRFLARIDSQKCLDRLVEMQLFTTRSDAGVYRYHEVFRSFLEGELIRSTEPEALEDLYLWAGRLLEESNATADAIRAYTMAGNEDAAGRLLSTLHDWPDRPWLDSIPDGLLVDPRLRMARARMLVRCGRATEALEEFGRLAESAKFAEVQQAAQAEADRLRRWIDPRPRPADWADWTTVVRAAVAGRLQAGNLGTREGLPAKADLPIFVRGVVALLQGEVIEARRTFDVVDHNGLSRVESIVASTFTALAWWLAEGIDPAESLERLRDEADRDQLTWATRLLRALLVGFQAHDGVSARETLKRLDEEADRCHDHWTPAIARLGMLFGASNNASWPDTNGSANSAWVAVECCTIVEQLRSLGADALALWAVAARHAVAQSSQTANLSPVVSVVDERAWAESLPGRLSSRLRGATTIQAYESDDDAHPLMRLLRSSSRPQRDSRIDVETATTSIISLRLFGSFEIVISGIPVALSQLRPRARSILRLLALHAGTPVHREVIMDAMWPETDPSTAGKRLHVAISAIRHQLGEAGPTLVRMAEAYQIGSTQRPVTSDLDHFDRAARDFATAIASADVVQAQTAAQTVLSLYAGELLVEEGPATWVVREREQRVQSHLEAVRYLLQARVAVKDWDAVAALSRQGLRVDRYQDGLWRSLFLALESSRREVDLERARLDYEALLLEIQVSGTESNVASLPSTSARSRLVGNHQPAEKS